MKSCFQAPTLNRHYFKPLLRGKNSSSAKYNWFFPVVKNIPACEGGGLCPPYSASRRLQWAEHDKGQKEGI